MTIPILDTAADTLARYDVVFCDIWGVVHDGIHAYPAACDVLAEFRAGGGTVILISNAPSTSEEVVTLLARKFVRRDAWDSIVTSGDLTRLRVQEAGIRRIFHIGAQRGEHVFDDLGVTLVDVEQAEAVVATELADYYSETPEDYRAVLETAYSRGLPFICANPDLVVHVGDDLLPCAGALALIYQELGGEVYWAGKPHAPVYERGLALAKAIRSQPTDRSRILAIGDALRTDIAGAQAFGLDALLIAGGIHRDDLMQDGAIDGPLLQHLAAPFEEHLIGAMTTLA